MELIAQRVWRGVLELRNTRVLVPDRGPDLQKIQPLASQRVQTMSKLPYRVLDRHLGPAAGGECPNGRVLGRHLEELQVLFAAAVCMPSPPGPQTVSGKEGRGGMGRGKAKWVPALVAI